MWLFTVFSRLFKSMFAWQCSSEQKRILIVGLDAAGKTTMLYRLKLGEVVTTIPTIGFNVETVSHKNVEITCWDVGGKDKIRPLWRHYYQNTSAVVMVVDTNDRERIGQARDELARMLSEDELQRIPLLVFANKQDLPNAMNVSEVVDKLGLLSLRGRHWHVQPCSATGPDADGLFEGLDTLVKLLQKPKLAPNRPKGESAKAGTAFAAIPA